MPTSRATACAVASLSPVSRTGRSPSARSRVIASADVGLTASATTSTPRARPSQPTAIAVAPSACAAAKASVSSAGRCCDHSSSSRGRPTRTAWLWSPASTTPWTPEALDVREVLNGRECAEPVSGCVRDGSGDGVLRGILERTGESQHLVAVLPVGSDHVDQRHLTGGDRAGLVEDDRVDRAGRLQHLGALDQDAQLRTTAGADHEGGGGGQPECARAGDDQDRHGRGECHCTDRRRCRAKSPRWRQPGR